MRLDALREPVYRFASVVIALGGALLVYLGAAGHVADLWDPPLALLVLATLTVLAENLPLKLPLQHDDVSFSPAQLFGFAVLIMFGLGPAVATWAGAALVSDLARRRAPVKVAFNVANYALSMAAAGAVLTALSSLPDSGPGTMAMGDLPAVALAAVALWAVNHVLASSVSVLAMGVSLRTWLAGQTPVVFLVDGLLIAFSPIVAVVAAHDLALLPLIAIPFAALYYSARVAGRHRHESLHDALTGMPNRVLFAQQVERAIRDAEPRGWEPAVLLLDVDRFKEINDALGHRAGDDALRHVARRLREIAGPSDIVARLGGDEFAVLRPGAAQEPSAALAARIRARLEEPILVGGVHVSVGASIGIAHGGGDGMEELIRRADVAMYQAKTSGGIASFDAARDPYRPERLERTAELRDGIPRGELVVHYQPKLSLVTGQIDGAEALVRWQHPRHGLLPPAAFIDLAEGTELMETLTLSVLASALDQAAAWRRSGSALSVAVNLSAQTMLDRSVASTVSAMLAERGLAGDALKLEITEHTLMRDPDRAAAVLADLSALGVRVSIDDFGTGYSSMALLQRLPVHEIKVDRSFVGDMTDNARHSAIVRSIVYLGLALGVEVVAEGVETEAVLQQLAADGCHTAQGFLISPPLDADAFAAWLRERTTTGPELQEAA